MNYEELELGKRYYFINHYGEGYLIGTGRLDMKGKDRCGFRSLKFEYWTTKLFRFNADRTGWLAAHNADIPYCNSLSVLTKDIYEFETLNDAILYAEVI